MITLLLILTTITSAMFIIGPSVGPLSYHLDVKEEMPDADYEEDNYDN